ncbi:L,D-transpeptidase family protein [Vibrio profundum]|uniref:L,D-transpeptidase family protein n=1 Tax=Vibrio profundum TaxID=2910247 RepID=UPI003D122AD0
MKQWVRQMLILFMISCFSSSVLAAAYLLPSQGSQIVGRTQYHVVKKGESLADIAKEYDVGFLSLMAANKGVDPFLPKEGYVLTVPTRIILPAVPREGIVINLAELRLYYFNPVTKKVHIFPVGIGRVGRDTPEMETTISQKRKQPTWKPPLSVRQEYKKKGIDLPDIVPSGPDNPLGDYALRLAHGIGDYLIHGTNKNFGIGLRVSSGCIRMEPKDIKWLFQHVENGEKVRVIDEPIKMALEPDRSLFVEAHEPLTRSDGSKKILRVPQELSWWLGEFHLPDDKVKAAITAQNGVPVEVVSSTYELN